MRGKGLRNLVGAPWLQHDRQARSHMMNIHSVSMEKRELDEYRCLQRDDKARRRELVTVHDKRKTRIVLQRDAIP